MAFVPLQVTSSFSLLQSTTRITELAKEAKKRGFEALALTDNNIMYGLVDFYNACRKEGIKPILGLKLNLFGCIDSDNHFPILLLAKDQIGYQHLMKISTIKNTQASGADLYYKQINEFLTHLIVIFPGKDSELVTLVGRGDTDSAQQLIRQIQAQADDNSVLIGLNAQQSTVLQNTLQQLGKTSKARTIVVPEVNYLNATDHFATQVLRDIDKANPFAIRNSLKIIKAIIGFDRKRLRGYL